MEVVHPPKLLLNMPSHQIGHRSSLALSVFRKGRPEADLCLTWTKFQTMMGGLTDIIKSNL